MVCVLAGGGDYWSLLAIAIIHLITTIINSRLGIMATAAPLDPSTNATDLKTGPFAVLYKAVRGNTQILVNVRNNHKLLGRVKAYDRHMNL